MGHWTLALALLPTIWASVKLTGGMAPSLFTEGFRSWWLYAAGGAAYVLIEVVIEKPMWLYVVGHEFTHAVSGLLSGAKIYSFRAASDGGEVRLSKSNAFIALSPYILPIYALFVLGLFGLARFWWHRPELPYFFKFFFGMALAFHVSLTVSALHRKQTDLKVLGFFLSGVLIVLGNILIFGALAVGLFRKTPTFPQYALGLASETVQAWKGGFFVLKKEANLFIDHHVEK